MRVGSAFWMNPLLDPDSVWGIRALLYMQLIHQRVIVNIFTVHILMCQILKSDIEILSCFELWDS